MFLLFCRTGKGCDLVPGLSHGHRDRTDGFCHKDPRAGLRQPSEGLLVGMSVGISPSAGNQRSLRPDDGQPCRGCAVARSVMGNLQDIRCLRGNTPGRAAFPFCAVFAVCTDSAGWTVFTVCTVFAGCTVFTVCIVLAGTDRLHRPRRKNLPVRRIRPDRPPRCLEDHR